jgi:ADP-ribosylglycohydrolase
MKDKILGGIIGFCVGDALGVPVEFINRESLKQNPVTDMRGYGTHNQPPGTWSDDTSMVLCFMDSFIRSNGLNYWDLIIKYISWMNEAEYTPYGDVFDIGNTTRSALEFYIGHPEKYHFQCGAGWIGAGGTSEYDNGNGSLMRILPYVFLLDNARCEKDAIQKNKDILTTIHEISSLTHNTYRCSIACGIYIFIAKRLIAGDTIQDAVRIGICDAVHAGLDESEASDKKNVYSDELKRYERIFDKGFSDLPQESIKSSGYIVDTLEAVIWCLLNTDNYESCVLNAVNLGGDTDTIAALAGGLAGIYYGINDIPEKFTCHIPRLDYIKQLCSDYFYAIKSADKQQFALSDLKIIQKYFHDLILDRNINNGLFLENENKKLPTITNKIREKEKWYPVPGMYGGFKYHLTEKNGKPLLIIESWCRVVGGSGQRHEITTGGCVCVEEGFV